MKEWEIFVPYLPRVKSTKRRWDENMISCIIKPTVQTLPLSDVNNRPIEWRRSNYFHPEMIPEPDYSDPEEADKQGPSPEDEEDDDDDDEEEKSGESEKASDSEKTTDSSGDESHISRTTTTTTSSESATGSSSGSSVHARSNEGLVLPKKPTNPYLQSAERQKLNKELKFNQKYGKSVVGNKSELQIAMEKYKENKLRKDHVDEQTSLEKLLEQRAKKIQTEENQNTVSQPDWMEKLKDQRDTWVDPKEDEFYRVHARVVAHGGYSKQNDDITPGTSKKGKHNTQKRSDSSSA